MTSFIEVPGDGVIGWRLEGTVDYFDVEEALRKCCVATEQKNVFLWQRVTRVSAVQNAAKGLYVEFESTDTTTAGAFKEAIARELG
jgi:hypothetical protein